MDREIDFLLSGPTQVYRQSDNFELQQPTAKALLHLMTWRRDVRSFRREALPEGQLQSLIEAACLAPSVGLSEPWRFVSVRTKKLRDAIYQEYETQNQLASLDGERYADGDYLKLKLAGLNEAPEQLAVFCKLNPDQGRGLGRRTMPETVEYSVVAAIQNLWLMARACGIGVGWVSILRPTAINRILGCPDEWKLIAYLCLGYPEEESSTPELERLAWESRKPIETKWIVV